MKIFYLAKLCVKFGQVNACFGQVMFYHPVDRSLFVTRGIFVIVFCLGLVEIRIEGPGIGTIKIEFLS